jgi:hypothetical protein
MSATLFYVARNRECYKKLAEEIRSFFQRGKDICGSKLAGCHYLRACIDESLRMSPPIAGTLWRELAPEEDGRNSLIIDGHVIPKDTYIGVGAYTLHHNEVILLGLLLLFHLGTKLVVGSLKCQSDSSITIRRPTSLIPLPITQNVGC